MTILRTRRWVLGAGGVGAAVLLGGAVLALRRDDFTGEALSPPEVLTAVRGGDLTLIDIRRPGEWAQTGIAEGAHPIDMRRPDFIEALLAITGGRRDVPVALICARGVRSDRMSARLAQAGFSRIIDVPEGMLGARGAGPGWLARGLPVVSL